MGQPPDVVRDATEFDATQQAILDVRALDTGWRPPYNPLRSRRRAPSARGSPAWVHLGALMTPYTGVDPRGDRVAARVAKDEAWVTIDRSTTS
jgi:hypothetical protein